MTGISIFEASTCSVVNLTSSTTFVGIHLINFSVLSMYSIDLSIVCISTNTQVSWTISTKTFFQVFQLYEYGNLMIAEILVDTFAFLSQPNCLDNSEAIFNTFAPYLILTSSLISGFKIRYQWYQPQLFTI